MIDFICIVLIFIFDSFLPALLHPVLVPAPAFFAVALPPPGNVRVPEAYARFLVFWQFTLGVGPGMGPFRGVSKAVSLNRLDRVKAKESSSNKRFSICCNGHEGFVTLKRLTNGRLGSMMMPTCSLRARPAILYLGGCHSIIPCVVSTRQRKRPVAFTFHLCSPRLIC